MRDRLSSGLTRRRMLIGLGVLGGGALGLGGLLGLRAFTESQPVTIGGTLPLSGQLEAIGVPLHRGLQLWAAEANANGGLAGRAVKLDIRDDRGDTQIANSTYEELTETADVLVSPYGSRLTAAVIDIVERDGVPCIAHTAGSRELWTEDRNWTVQLLNPIDTFLHSALDAAFQAGARSVSFLYRNDAFTPTTMEGAISRARATGWDVQAVAVYGSEAEISGRLEEVTNPTPDFLVGSGFQPGAPGGGFLPDAIALSRAYEQTTADAGLVCWSIGSSFPKYADRMGADANLVSGVTGWKPYVQYPGNSDFIDRYTQRLGRPPDSHAAQGFATGQLITAATVHAGSIKPRPLRDALFSIQTDTVFGHYAVNQGGLQVGKTNAVMQWQDGAPVVVGPERWQSGQLIY